ncbi:type IV toxin-antitoxin system AbiEi family antitoxin [Cellulomonas sp. P24]|uniref:type IV toxin-antitoxin system AbiEi family antitoxin domain-containing protein n=1 Tax=Cellulomonas sp. P24 TaxID=2885206 RepID=UPI00216B4B40|nr:type IV toxin-antitoxin system AbiEi family antitoxin [Cellulomonas sp. P24]MCR6491640.1 type IV toxin-antitoxin system AbiEi family antitoxin [Cellulomonas sp. P24]
MSARTEVVRRAARAPLRTIRTAELALDYAHPRQEIREFERRGLLHRLAHGIYCAIPPESDPATWRPTLEAATAAVATALYGDRVPVLTGLTAARVHRALPRAIGTGYVAVPTRRRPLRLADRDGDVRFVTRDVTTLDAVLVQTDLGPALATTPEQTVLDLARNDPQAEDVDALEAIAALWPECDTEVLEEIAARQRMRATLRRVAVGR